MKTKKNGGLSLLSGRSHTASTRCDYRCTPLSRNIQLWLSRNDTCRACGVNVKTLFWLRQQQLKKHDEHNCCQHMPKQAARRTLTKHNQHALPRTTPYNTKSDEGTIGDMLRQTLSLERDPAMTEIVGGHSEKITMCKRTHLLLPKRPSRTGLSSFS